MTQNLESALDRIEDVVRRAEYDNRSRSQTAFVEGRYNTAEGYKIHEQQAEQALADIQAIREAITQEASDEMSS